MGVGRREGGGVSVGGGWETKGRLNHPLAQRKTYCVFSKIQKQPVLHMRTRQSLGAV